MVSGEFIQIYKPQIGVWDCVCTCFFIDTANNVVEYLKVIYSMLKKGGVWINLGPLLYHFADSRDQLSIELSWEEIKYTAEKLGFKIMQESRQKCHYDHNKLSMIEKVYNCIFFTAIKV